MRERNAWYVRAMRGILAAALIWVPTASGAETWVGETRERWICPGEHPWTSYNRFTLDMSVGSGIGLLTIVGQGTWEVLTDWTVDGKWGYFSASFTDEFGGPYIFQGWMRGHRMKGYVSGHSYVDGCILMGKLKGGL